MTVRVGPATNDRAAAAITAQLAPGEELVWAGSPGTDIWTQTPNIITALVTAAWIFFLVFSLWSLGARDNIDSERIGYLLIATVGLVSQFYGALRRKNTFFGVTDRRVIVVHGLRDQRDESAAFGYVEKVTVANRHSREGTVTFSARHIPKSAQEVDPALDDSPMTGPVVFSEIEDADQVASLVNGILGDQRKQDWDAAIAARPLTFSTSGKLNIAYEDAGSGEPIIFLHGVGATKKCWAMQLHLLSRKFRCIALDYRGYGGSAIPPPGSISRETFSQDVAAVMDAAGIEKATLCGNSLGGVVALEFYRQFPKRVKSLVLVDSFAYYPGGAESIPGRLKTLDELGIEKFAETRAPALFAPDAPPWLVDAARADLASIPLDVYKASTSVTWSGDYRPLLPKVGVRTLVVWGEYDTKIAPRELSKELALTIPAATDLAVIRGAGHIPQMEAPLVFNLVLADFLS